MAESSRARRAAHLFHTRPGIQDKAMNDSIIYSLTVYSPHIPAEHETQTGYEYELSIAPASALRSAEGALIEASGAGRQTVPISGFFSFPNAAAPVISPIAGVLFLYSSPAIVFPLQLVGVNTAPLLPVDIQMLFTNAALSAVGGVVRFGLDWPGPLRDVAASFLGQRKP
jgi:hypothetical protein